ncbi:MAG: hypothetical protein V7L14_01290 [Nostoc sp.]|uniref:hypothetical protein n=1 Tax=Nostoc sp. TaxID=1180 RepID=UPI002FFA36C0
MPSQGTGAQVDPRSLKPSIDLATLIELLTQAISPSSNQANTDQRNPSGMQLFEFDDKNKRLRTRTSAVMYRLFSQPKFKEAFKPAEGGGFIQNLSMPGRGNRSRVGGCLSDGNAKKLPSAIDKLMAAIDQALNTAVPSDSLLSTLLLDDADKQLKKLAKSAGTSFQDMPNTANLVPIAFQAGDSKANKSDKSVATVISARERVENSDYFEQMCRAAADYLENQRGNNEEDVASSIATLEDEQNRYDSQIQRFLNFLDDEALSRVRLTISFRIMEAIADNARSSDYQDYQLLAEYVNRILTLVKSAKQVGYTVDLTAHFGIAAEFNLSDYLNQATFYYCLAVWPESETQIFEQKTKNQVDREVSYRFRVNGQNPELGKPAFEARLDQIGEDLLSDDQSSSQKPWVRRRLAELIFLAVVVPKQGEESLSEESLTNSVLQLLGNLKSNGKEAISQTLDELRERSQSMKSIAKALMKVVRDKSQKVMSQVQDRSSQQFICVKRSIINWPRLEGADPGVRNLLVEPQSNSSEKVEWFKHIEICEQPAAPGLLFSVKVTAELSEYDLTTKGTRSQIRAKRLLPQKLLQVCWVPRSWQKKDRQWTYELSANASKAAGWVLPAAIILEYDVETVKRRTDTRGSEENKQYHAAAVTAFAVLVYCCLWRIIRRLQQRDQEKSVDFTTLMLRLQETGKQLNDDKDKSGDAYVYAAAQTLEAILAEDTPIRMQGLILENLAKQTDTTKFIKSGTFKALLSAFPLCISSPGSDSAPKIGLISYAIRPCNEGNFLSEDEKAYLFLTQSYIATAVSEPFIGYELKRERMRSDVLDSPEQLKTQRLVKEEIRYLKAQGCQHIILLAHAYGDRRMNRAANHNSSLIPTEFLEEVFETFPDLNIYPMVRDVFPATRLHLRGDNEAAFEILQAVDHTDFQRSVRADYFRDLIPVYTFATLHAIQAEDRLQSGFCIYFLVSDAKAGDLNSTQRARQHFINPDLDSPIHDCLLAVLRGLHFIEAERGVQKGQLIPVLDPFSWISPTTVEGAGEVKVLHTRRRGDVLLNYRAVLTHVSQVLHRRK